jgi:hypothetical protein
MDGQPREDRASVASQYRRRDIRGDPMRVLMMLSLACLLAACQSNAFNDRQANCGPGGMGCREGPMPYGDIDGAVGGVGPN